MSEKRAIIAEDEGPLRRRLRTLLASLWPDLTICGEAEDGVTALELMKSHHPHVAFLDIMMPGISGMEVADRFQGTCHIVFITAYNKYAIEAFERDAVDYILKPVTEERLSISIDRLKKELSAPEHSTIDFSRLVNEIASAVKGNEGYLQWIKAEKKGDVSLIPVDDIYYFKASEKYTIVRTKESEFIIRMTIKELAEELDPSGFWRVHRAAIANIRHIRTVERPLAGGYSIRFKDLPDRLPVSRAYRRLFREM